MTLLRSLLLLLALSFAANARAELPAGISGAWYNPQQSGHGFTIQILSPQRALMFWYLYDANGNPLFLYIDGNIVGRSIAGTAYAPRGMRFGQFDRADLQLPPWGTVRIDFSGCDNARMHYAAVDAAFGTGSIALQRLTRIKDSTCALVAPAVRSGLYDASTGGNIEAHVAIDEDARLWGMNVSRLSAGEPSLYWGGFSVFTAVMEGTSDASGTPYRLEVSDNQATMFTRDPPGPSHTVSTSLMLDSAGVGTGHSASGFPFLTLRGTPHPQRELQPSLTTGDLAGQYRYTAGTQFFGTENTITIDAQGALRLESRGVGFDVSVTQAAGRIDLVAGNAGFFDFRLGTYQGRGWLELDRNNGEQELVLIGAEGVKRLGILARKMP